ncbi:hypothetical protein [Bradyrhizobium huanghuaihaiense]|uniref:hypothetical protein n=1 Tax=Bradyrhizobium huanghuaihaiense TaxID=990078 RepID=UPI0011A7A040|nr:hypothetical protein [Bradyrhizobium huanghuaihaiense]
MKKPNQILLFLASSSIGPEAIYEFFRWVERVGANRGTQSVLNLREHSEQVLYSSRGRVSNTDGDAVASPRLIGREAERLLAGAGMPNQDLVAHIHRELRIMGVPLREIPPFNKISLSELAPVVWTAPRWI